LCHVHLHRQGVTPRLLDFLGDLLGRRPVEVRDHGIAALARNTQAVRPADPVAPAGYDDGLAFE
jgi:hypothetical protein